MGRRETSRLRRNGRTAGKNGQAPHRSPATAFAVVVASPPLGARRALSQPSALQLPRIPLLPPHPRLPAQPAKRTHTLPADAHHPAPPPAMGRRKIEIQPITHERNRSVTFLKRKNGLFKKAYELGVLCSVDVAVIIFEERPGHHVKLYQYCSTDVNSMVQRHLRFDGEKDTRVPSDFNNKQAEEAADDDDEADDDSPKRQNVSGTSKAGAGKVKSEGSSNGTVPIRPVPTSTNESSMTIDLEYRTRVSPTGSTPTSTLPVSGERHTALRAAPGLPKRPRLDDGAPTPSMQLPPSYPYRLELDMSQYPVQSHITPLPSLPPAHGVTHPSLQYPHTHVPSVTGMMGGGGSGAGFLPQLPQAPFDLSAHQGGPPPTLRSVSFSQGSYASQGMYRTQPQMQMQGAAGMAVELLEGAGAQGSAQQFAPFDWPVHNAQSQETSHPSSATESSSNWFDFLSGGTNTSSAQASNLFPSHARGSLSSRSFAESPGAGLKRVREEDAGSMSMSSDIGGDGDDKPGGRGMERRSVSVHTPPS